MAVQQFICFKLANEEYAIDIRLVQECIKVTKITRVPQMPAYCLGVINSRGSIIPVFDMRRKFKLPALDVSPDARLLVATLDRSMISILVDAVMDNVTFDMDLVDPAPSVKMHIDREYIAGLGELEGRMIVILDLEKMHARMLDEIESAVGSSGGK